MADQCLASSRRVAVCEIDIEHPVQEAHHKYFDGYSRVFAVLRFRGVVVGTTWLPTIKGRITLSQLKDCARGASWNIWSHMNTTFAGEWKSTSTLTASVVVCTRDRTDDLAKCLPKLLPYAAQGHEIVVIDSCPSNEDTQQLVAQFPHVRYVREPRPGAGIARNCGLLSATKEVIAFTDDDAQVDAGWLGALLRNFDDPNVALVTGITMPTELETDAQLWFEEMHGFARGFVRKQFEAESINPLSASLVGASVNMAVRRSSLDDVGWFDEALGPGTPCGSGEDHDFFYRVLARGYRVIYDPAALVWHRHRRDWRALQRAIHGYGLGVFAWWTRALVVEKEMTLLKLAPRWFFDWHVRQLGRALLKRPNAEPLDLAWAEFLGALKGPIAYLRSIRKSQSRKRAPLQIPRETLLPVSTAGHKHIGVGTENT